MNTFPSNVEWMTQGLNLGLQGQGIGHDHPVAYALLLEVANQK